MMMGNMRNFVRGSVRSTSPSPKSKSSPVQSGQRYPICFCCVPKEQKVRAAAPTDGQESRQGMQAKPYVIPGLGWDCLPFFFHVFFFLVPYIHSPDPQARTTQVTCEMHDGVQSKSLRTRWVVSELGTLVLVVIGASEPRVSQQAKVFHYFLLSSWKNAGLGCSVTPSTPDAPANPSRCPEASKMFGLGPLCAT